VNQIGLVLFGALVGFVATLIGDRWKLVHASRTAAMMVVRELEFHKLRLRMAVALDQLPEAQYQLMFPSPIWSAHGSTLLAGAPPQEAEAVLNWYASMAVLGYALDKRIGPEGPQLSGPDRSRLQAALTEAHLAAQRLTVRWSLRKGSQVSASLFDEVAN
jgi:hypothetical protein